MLHGAHYFHVFSPFLRLTSPGSIFQEKRCNANTSRGKPFSAHFGFRRGIEGDRIRSTICLKSWIWVAFFRVCFFLCETSFFRCYVNASRGKPFFDSFWLPAGQEGGIKSAPRFPCQVAPELRLPMFQSHGGLTGTQKTPAEKTFNLLPQDAPKRFFRSTWTSTLFRKIQKSRNRQKSLKKVDNGHPRWSLASVAPKNRKHFHNSRTQRVAAVVARSVLQ